MKILAAVLLAALTLGAYPQTPSDQSSRAEQRAFTKIERIGERTGRSFFVFSTAEGRNYTIRHDGHAEVSAVKVLRRNFDLRMGLSGRLERFYYLEHEGDLLLVYETTDGRQTRAFAERMDQKTLKPRWLTPLDGFRLGAGLAESNCIYLPAANLLVKIDLQTGSYLWQTDFEQPNSPVFDEFLPPRIAGDLVLFKEDVEKGRTIEVDKTTGKILRIN